MHRIKLNLSALISLYFGYREWFLGCSVCFGLNVRVERRIQQPVFSFGHGCLHTSCGLCPGHIWTTSKTSFSRGLKHGLMKQLCSLSSNKLDLGVKLAQIWAQARSVKQFLNSTCRAETLQVPRNWSYFRLNLNLDADRNPYRAAAKQFSWERFQLKYN